MVDSHSIQGIVEELAEKLVVKHGINSICTFHESFLELGWKDVISPTDFKNIESSLQSFHETFNIVRGFFQNVRKLNKVRELRSKLSIIFVFYYFWM